MKPEVVIPAHPKDYSKLPYVIKALRDHVNIGNIHVICPDPWNLSLPDVALHADDEVLPFDKSLFKYRPEWCYQQFLKLFGFVTEGDWFLVTDADIIVARDIPLVDPVDGFPILYKREGMDVDPYFEFNKAMIGYGELEARGSTFLSELTLYNKNMVYGMMGASGCKTVDEVLEKSAAIIGPDCFPAESVWYGHYIMRYHPYLYNVHALTSALGGQYASHVWTPEEIENEIKTKYVDCPGADLFSLHSWEGRVD